MDSPAGRSICCFAVVAAAASTDVAKMLRSTEELEQREIFALGARCYAPKFLKQVLKQVLQEERLKKKGKQNGFECFAMSSHI